jgi:hypothetical protein
MFNEDSIKPLPQETNQWLLRNFGFQVVNDELMRLQRVIVLRHDITDQILENAALDLEQLANAVRSLKQGA